MHDNCKLSLLVVLTLLLISQAHSAQLFKAQDNKETGYSYAREPGELVSNSTIYRDSPKKSIGAL
ncbi:hypothetical protein [Pseudoalteromonas luteoviolacea]|uniref:hypothetical protein n=1 Tax=Pseudoalteromonas luteoviolacea TaxID=43657 RepID=UPI001B37D383|nr:hypothetical protein [Pseudoalteromonas luteoviolacea]MBQ4834932.1 hypothetical protein [Pseudoalteromonas luteoviolacea]